MLSSHFETAWYFFTLEIVFKRRKQANIYIYCFVALKKSEQAEIVAFNRLVVNYNIHFFLRAETRELVLTVVTQDRKIWNERTNDFSESRPWILSFLCKTRKENNIYLIHLFIIENVELRLIENG